MATGKPPVSPPPERPRVKLWGLALAVVVAHAAGLEWMLTQHGGLSRLTEMAATHFNQEMDVRSPTVAPPPTAPQPVDPTPTFGQRVQARQVAAPTRTVPVPDSARIATASPKKFVNPKPAAVDRPSEPQHVDPAPPKAFATTAESARRPENTEPLGATAEPTSEASAAEKPGALPLVTPAASAGSVTPAANAVSAGASSPATAPDTSEAWRHWPDSTRLVYQLKGFFRGEFSGSAKVDWRRQNERYQAQVAVDVALLVHMTFTSQGRIQPSRLWPEVYEEERRGKKRGARFTEQWVTLDNGTQLPRPADLQDTASQFVQLAQDLRTGRLSAQSGQVVSVMLGRPGGVDLWQYDLTPGVLVDTPLGAVEAIHLKPRPLEKARGTVTAEMWFAPKLQHLPVRIRLQLNPETWLDLTLQQVLQAS